MLDIPQGRFRGHLVQYGCLSWHDEKIASLSCCSATVTVHDHHHQQHQQHSCLVLLYPDEWCTYAYAMLAFRDHFITQCRCIRHQDARWLRPPSLIVQAGIGVKVQGLLGLLSSCRHGDWGCRAEGGTFANSLLHCRNCSCCSLWRRVNIFERY